MNDAESNPSDNSPGGTLGPEVLIVDDLVGTREVLRSMLEDLGFVDIVEAADGREALDRIKERTPRLIISDYHMQDMNGLDLLRTIRNSPGWAEIPFIMFSARSDLPVINDSLKQGAVRYLLKPISFDILKRAIFEVMRRRMT